MALRGFQIEDVDGIEQLTLDAPQLTNVRIVNADLKLTLALTVTLVIKSCYLPLAITLAITLVVILTPFTLSMVIAFWL